MSILSSLDRWKHEGTISPQQHAQLSSLVREDPFSLTLEINFLLYAGILAFVAGLGWTVATWSQQLGDVVIVAILTLLLSACLWFTYHRAAAWAPTQQTGASPVADYVLYLGCLVWCLELSYLEERFHLLSGQWDVYLLLTAAFFFLLAYRFDNRFVLSLALTSLAGWFGITVSHWPSSDEATYRKYSLLYCLAVAILGIVSNKLKIKQHFFGSYLNIFANVLFFALLSGVFTPNYGVWLLGLMPAVTASLTWGLTQRQFVFIAYAAVYGYIGVSSLLLRQLRAPYLILLYCVLSALAMIVFLVILARKFARPA